MAFWALAGIVVVDARYINKNDYIALKRNASECCKNKLTAGHIGFLVVFDAVMQMKMVIN
jgi:hypothetical protein